MTSVDWPAWACPTHRVQLERSGDELVCAFGERFPSVRGIPRFVPKSDYAEAFGLQWNRYRRTQLDSYSGTTITRDRARRCLGADLWARLDERHVLECGCGAGRFTEVLLGRGARVSSVDLSDAVEANAENFPENEHHRVAQADILALPFAPRQFDLVFCLGVIQHTPSPERTIAALSEQVKPGGWLVIDHYTRYLLWYTKTAPLLRLVMRRLSPERGMRWCEAIVRFLWPIHVKTRGSFLSRAVLHRLSPVIDYGRAYPELSEGLLREWALLDTHDSLTDHYKHRRSRGQIRRTLQSLGMEDIWCERGGNGIEARGRRPVGP